MFLFGTKIVFILRWEKQSVVNVGGKFLDNEVVGGVKLLNFLKLNLIIFVRKEVCVFEHALRDNYASYYCDVLDGS